MASAVPFRRYCAAANCDAKEPDHLFGWPRHKSSTDEQRRLWTQFVTLRVSNFNYSLRSRLCFRHFDPSCFTNWNMYKMMTTESVRLTMRRDSDVVPTINVNADELIESPRKEQATTSALPSSERRKLIRGMTKPISNPVIRTVHLPQRSRIPVPIVPESSAEQPGPAVSTKVDKGVQLRRCLHRPKFRSMQTQTDPKITRLPEEQPRKKVVKVKSYGVPFNSDECLSKTTSVDAESETSSDEEDISERKLMDQDDDEDWMMGSDEEIEYDAETSTNEETYHVGERTWYNEPKVIVSHHKLEELLSVCPMCSSKSAVEMKELQGAYVRYQTSCLTCTHSRDWANSEKVGRIALINILLCAGILFTGCLPTKVTRMMSQLSIKFPSKRSFIHYQTTYLHGIVREVATDMFSSLHEKLKGTELKLNGDGRFDSPGHSALYGIYTLMDCVTSKIVGCELVKSTEVSSSSAMELEGLKRCRSYIDERDLRVADLTTDRHSGIIKFVSEKWTSVRHWFDCWHLAKSLRKRASALANQKVAFNILHKWVPALVDHMHYVVANTSPGQLRKEWWLSAVNHICNQHQHDFETFPKCMHGHLAEEKVDDDGNKLVPAYLNPETQNELITKLEELVKDFVEPINQAGEHSTSELESFHSCLNRNAPKMEGFSYSGMKSRLQLTILHHNENCQRPVKLTRDGRKMRRIQRSKATKQVPTVQYVRTDPTYGYLKDLFQKLSIHLEERTKPDTQDKKPLTLASKGPEYTSLDQVEERTAAKRRGLITKPHYVTEEEMALARKRAMRGRGTKKSASRSDGASSSRP